MFIVQYTTSPATADQNQQLIERVFAELRELRPDGFSYGSLRLDDGVSFVHLGQANGVETPLNRLDAFHRFQEGIGDRITGPPVRSEATILGTYQLFTDSGLLTSVEPK
jgi:hypothetical protein